MKLLQKWDRRYTPPPRASPRPLRPRARPPAALAHPRPPRSYFVLPPEKSVLSYYKSEEDARMKPGEPLGFVECAGAHMFLKEVTKEKHYRFTVRSKERELKLLLNYIPFN